MRRTFVSSQKLGENRKVLEGAKRPIAGDACPERSRREPREFFAMDGIMSRSPGWARATTSRGEGGRVPPFIEKLRTFAFFTLYFCALAATFGLDYQDAENTYKKKDFASALSILRTLAEKEDGKAQYSLGLMLAKGEGTPKNFKEAYVWASLALENAPDDYYKARSSILLEKIEKRFSPEQLKNAKVMLEEKRQKIAYKKANPDHVDWEVAKMSFEMGNYDEGIRNFENLAGKNDKRAIYFLGEIYSTGKGVTPNMEEAAKWFQKGSDQGFPDCTRALAGLYVVGRGVPQDDEKAVKLFEKAAEAGDAKAQAQLARCLSVGRGTDKDLNAALKWSIIAADQGQNDAEELMRSLKNILSEEDWQKAQDEAKNWHDSTGK